ncbi:MAG: hypothetical protein ABI175_15745, partial [Polyangiales bacterium]
MVRSTEPHRASSRLAGAATCAVLAFVAFCALGSVSGCFDPGAGQEPPDKGLYFPVGLAISQSGKTLFVVNSNFDLRFNAGTLQALDVAQIWSDARLCAPKLNRLSFDAAKGAKVPVEPDRTCSLGTDVTRFIKTSVRIGAFGADIASTPHYGPTGDPEPAGSPRGRLLIPVRGDATMTIVDYEETIGGDGSVSARKLICGRNPQANSFGSACAGEWKVGADASQNSRALALEGEPFSVAVPTYWPDTPLAPGPTSGDALGFETPRNVGGIAAIVHQQTGDVSVFVRTAAFENQTIPQAKLAFTIGGLPAGGTFITPLDIIEHPFTPRFLVTTRTQANVFVVSFFADKGSPDRSGLAISEAILLSTQNPGFDSRGVVVDPPEDGEKRPIRVFLTNRTPASLVIGEVDPVDHHLRFKDNEPLPIGPSRIVRARVDVELPDGTFVKRTRIFAASFDGRFVTSYDPDLRRTTDIVRTGKGPYTMVVSPASGTRGTKEYRPALGFITNFTDSTIQVLDLDPRAGLLDDELDAAGRPELKAPPGTIGPLYGQ